MPPLKFFEKGVIKGLEPDYINLLSEYTGINFQLVVCDFKDMDTKVKSGETDMFLSVYVPERFAYTIFTKPFMDFDQIIVTRSDAPFTSGLDALKGKKVAVLKGLKLHEKILAPYSEIEIVHVDTMEQMFKVVSESKADALISKTYLAAYVMNQYPNLKIAGIADIPRDPYYYAVRKDYPELVSILNKAIQSIPNDRVNEIVQKWFSVRVEYRPNWSEILKWALVIGGVFTLILGLSLFWNRRLAREIDKRKRAEVTINKLNAELEKRVRDRTAQLEASNRELESVSYSVSHDLRAPLRSIDGFSQALLEEYGDKLNETGQSYLERVRKAAQMMGFLIDDMLKLLKVIRSEFHAESMDLSKMVREILQTNQQNNPDRSVDVIIQEGIMVQGDPYLMRIALVNLLDNAWKFTVNTWHPRIEFGMAVKDGETACFVRDNGVGFDMAYLDKLFGAFQRLQTREEFTGTGIGLATVKRIINRHGGHVWAEGEVGRGATFYFTLPSSVISS
jgi:signal transduction histidine kinase